MKISDTIPGKAIVQLAGQIATAKTAPAQTRAPAQASAPAPLDLQRATQELKGKLDQLRTMLGQAAVNQLMAELPAAALSALKDLSPALPILPGQSPYLAYKEKAGQLLAYESTIRARHAGISEALSKVINHYEEEPRGHGVEAVRAAQGMKSPDDVKLLLDQEGWLGHKSTPEERGAWLGAADKQINAANAAMTKAWPEIPSSLLLKGALGAGPGLGTLDELSGGRIRQFETLKVDLGMLRAADPGYIQLQKDVMALEGHLGKTAFPTPDQIMDLKAEILSDQVSVKELHSEATRMIAEIEGMTDASQIKRESLANSASGTARNQTDTVNQGVVFTTRSTTSSSSSVDLKGTSQTLNMAARDYAVQESPSLADMRERRPVQGHNTITSLETSILLERLLATRRVYEGMLVREPDSAYTNALRGWMEESTFKINGASSDSTVKMGDLRADILMAAEQGHYPKDRLDIVREELGLGPARPNGKLAGLKPLSSL